MVGGPQILIVGGGYGGMHTALRLERLLRPGEATVTVADSRSYMTHQPLHAKAAGGAPRVYRYASADLVASLGLYLGVAGVYGVRMRGFPAWLTHRTYHLLKLPTMNRRLRVVSSWTLALLFRREVVSLDALEHPRQDFQTALRASATGPSHETSFPAQKEKEAEHHAYHR